MPHIDLNNDQPGIVGLFQYRPETGRPMSELAEVLLRGPGTLGRGERELIAAHVSALNECAFCAGSHSAFAAAQLDGGAELVEQASEDPATAPLPAKMKALLAIAGAVTRGGREVTPELVKEARLHGATDPEIHDTVLIAAVFCMFNRYVDGLDTVAPADPAAYTAMAGPIVAHGYLSVLPSPDREGRTG
ncbi:carboxymuconolactone decarboxylase family protein [Actinomadura logoneensis]|uniref:Carboxymuconolactone decarboxylase family protein n=1 Tax=Actinomadura logoneensis TaxID=2293572 RepID=A0A372JFT5_9ACTN|nr:peroxidase-related enzyme [Actinomadura logoneensis]RFU38714.1 carboxymuconolactone decarboxylase family protein [Actinomadura logoneensis]